MAGPVRIHISGPTKSSAPSFTRFALGTRPPSLRSPRIKPAENVTQYAKSLNIPKVNAGFGDTGKTGES